MHTKLFIFAALTLLRACSASQWQVTVRDEVPAHADRAQLEAELKAELTAFRASGASEQAIASMHRSGEQVMKEKIAGRAAQGNGFVILTPGREAVLLPIVVFNSGGKHERLSLFIRGIGVKYVQGGSFIDVAPRDLRGQFRVLGERAPILGQAPGKVLKQWKDDQGRAWVRVADQRPGESPNFADVRLAEGKVVEAISFLGSEGRFLRFSRVWWKDDKPFSTLIHEKYVDEQVDRRLTLSDWKPTEMTARALMKRIPLGMPVLDTRLKSQIQYDWTGQLVPTYQLAEMVRKGEARQPTAQGSFNYWIPVGCGVGFLTLALIRRTRKVH